MQLVRRVTALAFASALLLGAACSNDDDGPTGLTTAQVVGTYQATTFTATQGSVTADVIALGGSLRATFNADGTVTGHTTIPTESVDEDFAGRWKIDGAQVKIEDVSTDIFFADLTFSVAGNTLVSDETINGVSVRVTMVKQ